MRADNSHHLIAAARNRSEAARQRATAAVRRMDATGIPITFESVAREARVSRSWLYANPALRAEIERLRTPARLPRPAVPIRQRASDDSLRTRLQAAVDRVRVLEAENRSTAACRRVRNESSEAR